MNAIKKNDLFVTSWGYDQTNYDYIVVVEVSKTGKTAKCQRTRAVQMGTSLTTNLQKPVAEPFGEVFTMRIKAGYRGDTCLKGSYPYLHTGTGSKRLDMFSPVEPERLYQETKLEFGH